MVLLIRVVNLVFGMLSTVNGDIFLNFDNRTGWRPVYKLQTR